MAVDTPQTKALLHFNGANASTVFIDESGKTWTANGNAQISTAQFKFGGAAGLFDGTGDWIDTPDSADFDVGSGDFTVDCWVRRAATGVNHRIWGQTDSAFTPSASSAALMILSDIVYGNVYTGSTLKQASSTGTITDTNWHHTAMIRNGNNLYVALDGTLGTPVDITGITINNSANKFAIGRNGEYTSETLNGYIDEFRFSKGVARWTANFTPPTFEYNAGAPSAFF